ncbi:MAG: hypothetical protein JWP58_3151 [Hymenobacter sp.]|nr:hypothetical protein [Hymenobacter sp.]
MMHKLPSLLLAGGLLLLASAAQAQVTFSMGPRLGLNVSSAPFKDDQHTYDTGSRLGAEAGFAFDLNFGHFALQPALLYSQKGFTINQTYTTTYTSASYVETTRTMLDEEYRLNYVTIPLNFAYALRADGQGLQLFAGPYFGLLLGGNFKYSDRQEATSQNVVVRSFADSGSGNVVGGDYYSPGSANTKFYSRSKDAGLQFGLGYRKRSFLLQAGYSMGLRDLGADLQISNGIAGPSTINGPTYYNRAFQLSLAYLLGPKG